MDSYRENLCFYDIHTTDIPPVERKIRGLVWVPGLPARVEQNAGKLPPPARLRALAGMERERLDAN